MTRALLALLAALAPGAATAHPLGNVSTNRWVALEARPGRLDVRYVLDLAELPAHREMPALDTDGDGAAGDAERAAWAARQAAALAPGLLVTVDGRRAHLVLHAAEAEVARGTAGLPLLRADVRWHVPLGDAPQAITFRDTNFAGRPGWREVIARAVDGTALAGATVPERDRSDALRRYPERLLAEPPAVSEAAFTVAPAPAGPRRRAGAPALEAGSAGTPVAGDRMRALASRLDAVIADPAPLAPGAFAAALALAGLLGALHALGPGHGKTIVGAWLVGTRGTSRHAVLLGGIVTATHTAGVFALGLTALAASHWLLPERLLPWLSVASGLLVVAVGCSLAARRLGAASATHGHPHDHHHHDRDDHHHHHGDHDGHGHHRHLPPPGEPVRLRGLVALGVSGGLVPCPSALLLMLGAIAVGRTALGIVLVLAFSTGLAAVLTAVGLLLVRARHLFDRVPSSGRLVRFAPVASAVIISLAGLAIVVQALAGIGA